MRHYTDPVCDFIHLVVHEVIVAVEVLVAEHALAHHLVRDLPLHVHHKLEHLIVGGAREQNLARVEFVDCAAHGEHVARMVVANTYYCKWN